MKTIIASLIALSFASAANANTVAAHEIMDTMSKQDTAIIQKMVRTTKPMASQTWDKGTKHITVYQELSPAEAKCRPVQLVNGKLISNFYSCEVEPNKYFLFDKIEIDVD